MQARMRYRWKIICGKATSFIFIITPVLLVRLQLTASLTYTFIVYCYKTRSTTVSFLYRFRTTIIFGHRVLVTAAYAGGEHGEGMTSAVLPLKPCMKSGHL